MQATSLSRISEFSDANQNFASCLQKTKLSKTLKVGFRQYYPQNLVFIDENVERYQDLVEGVKSDTEVFILDSRYDGVKQISQILEDYQELDSIQIVSHGTVGTVNIGSIFLTLENLAVYQLLLQKWKKAMKVGGGILLLGCTIAAGKKGANFVRKLSQLTGINIAASEDLTGSAALGGNWNLGFSTGEINASLAFEPEILAAYSSVLSVLIDETFRGATVAGPWFFGKGIGGTSDPFLTAAPIGATGVFPGPPTGTSDPIGNGALRLTSAANNEATFVIYNNPIASNAGLVFTFDLFAYGGGEPGADGISFFLIDGNTPLPKVGGFGGSLGYAQRLDQNFSGLSGGYVGIGFDEFGNFPTNGLFSQQERPTGINNQPGISSVAIRGKTGSSDPTGSSLTTGYDYLTGNISLPAPIGFPNQTTRSDTIKRRARITLTPDQTLAVDMDFNNNGSFSDPGENVIPAFNLQTGADVAGLGRTIPANGTVPATFKFGFASSTGSSKNIHEVRDLKVETVNPPTNQADIVTTKTGPATVEPNGNITYTVTTTNNGPDEAVNVLLQDQLPASLTFVSASNGGGLDAANPKTQVITWPVIPALGVGQSVNYTLTVQAPASGGPFVNGAFSTATTFDPNSSNNNGTASNAQVTTAIASGADVSTTKTGPATASPGSPIAYTITTTNNGASTATNVVISDQLSPGLSGVQVSDGGSYNSTTGLVSFPPIASLANGSSTTRTISFTAPAEETTIADTVSSTSDTPDPNPANNDGTATNAKVTTTIASSADVAVTKTGATTAVPGEVITYTITATNNGPSTATNIAITDTLPTNLVGVQASNNGTYDPSTGIVTFPAIASLAQGAIASRTVTITAPSSGSVVNTAKSTAATADPTPTNNNGTASTATVTTTISSTATPAPPNQPPLANNVNLNLPVGSTSQVVGLGATDPDGTIAFYTINTLPPAAQGVLYLGDPANGGTPIATGQSLTPTQLTQLFFQSTGNFTGTNFTYSATDNQGAVSPAAATVSAIASPNQPPVVTNANFNLPVNSTTNLTGLGATDPDGTIASYTLNTLPPAAQGILYVGDPANGGTPATAGQTLTPDQIDQLFFQSTGNFTGTNFTYSATDNQGAISPASAGVSLIQPATNQPPVVNNVNVSLPVGSATQVTGLGATDPDGTIASYTINTLPPAAQGVLYLGDPATGGTPVTANQTLTPTELGQLFFQSGAGFTQGSFTYSATDNLGATSPAAATVSAIASPNQPPVTNNVNTRLGQGVKAQLTGLGGTDPDGAISAYRINTLPAPEQGALYLGDPENGGTSVTVGQTLTPNQLGQLLFQSAVTFTGADFTYSAIDNRSTASLTPGTVALIKPVTPPPTPLPNPTPAPAIVPTPTPTISATPTPTPEIAPSATPTTSATPTPTPTATPIPTPISPVPLTPTPAPASESTPPLNLESIVFFSPVVEPDTTCDCETLPERPPFTFPSAQEQPQVTFDGPDGSLIATDRIVDGSEGDDILNGSNSNERFLALQGNDTLLGKAGDNILYGHEDGDEILAGQGSDIVFGGKQGDVIQGGKGRDRILGDLNSDTLYGDRNSDTLVGDNGQYDSLNFANNRDLLFGNSEDDVINGTEGSDTVYGGKAQDIAYGGKQNDWVAGDLDADTLVGDLGDDSLFGGSFNPLVRDSEGRDLLLGQEGSDLLYGQEQEDTLVGGSDLDALFGGKQDDRLFGESNSDTLYGNRGRDILVGDYGGPNPIGSGGEQDLLFGNGSGDAIAGGFGNDTVHAGKQEDIVYGGKDPDLMWGEFANDTLIGDEGDDTLYGGTANSSVRDFQGQDLLLGTGGADFLNGNEGNDSISGGDGNDTLRGGENEDLLQGDAGDDWMAGDRGNDDLCGGEGNDTLFGDSEATALGTGDDCINGNNGDDVIYGNDGSDTLNGDANNDSLIGGKGNDILSGGDGNDWLVGGLGVDSLIGGLGSDSFGLSPDGDADAVFNFEVGQDKFVLTGGLTFDQLLISQGGNGASIQIASTGQAIVTVLGASNLLTQADFLLV